MSDSCGSVGLFSKYVCRVKSYIYGNEPDLKPKDILADMSKNDLIKKIEAGEITLHDAQSEGFPAKGEDGAVAIMQRGLIALGLIKADKCVPCWWTDFSFGLYGPQTTEAIRQLQATAGIKYEDERLGKNLTKEIVQSEPTGQRLGPQTITILKNALEAKAQGKNWKAEIKPKE